MSRLNRRWSDPLLLALFVLCVYLVTASADLLHNGDTDLRIQTAQSFVDHFHVWIAHPMWLDNRTAIGRGGHLYAYYAPGQEVLLVPLYILGQVLAQLINLHFDLGTVNVVTLYATRSIDLILGAILAAVFYLLAVSIGFRRNSAVVLTLVFALATAAWPDAQSALEQTQVDLCLLLAVLAEWTFVKHGMVHRRWLLLSGAALGFGLLTRYDFAIYLAPVVLFPVALRFAYGKRGALKDILSFVLGIAPGIVLVGFWNWVRFDNVLTTGLHERTFGEPPLLGLGSLLISPGKGLIWYVPILFLLPWAVPAFVRRVPALSLLLFSLFLFPVTFYATIFYWHGDPAWGPRYIYVALPYLVLPLGEIVDGWQMRARVLRAAAIALVLVSLAIQVAAVSVTQWRYWYHQEVLLQKTVDAEAWTGQPFHWGPRRYHYYWDASQSPVIRQFVELYQVIRLDSGDQRYLLTGQPDPYVSSPVPNYPVNALNFWWTDERHPVLGPHTRAGLAAILGLIGLLSLAALLRTMSRPPRVGRRLTPVEVPAPETSPQPADLPRLASGDD